MIFVTGGTGLVGSHVLLELVRAGKKVRALRRNHSNLEQVKSIFRQEADRAEELFNEIEWAEGDILDVWSLDTLLRDVDIIYHCAGLVSFDNSLRDEVLRNNIDGTMNLVNAALKCDVRRFCHVSSIASLGKNREGTPVNENSAWMPASKNTAYAESKFYSELEVWRGMAEGLDAVIVNPSVIIGPGDWSKGSCKFFPRIYKGLRFYTTGITGFVDVRDVADAIMILTEDKNFEKAKNQRFLLNAENLQYGVFLNMIAGALNRPGPTIKVSPLFVQAAGPLLVLFSFLTGSENDLTRETLMSSIEKQFYDGSGITGMFGFTYRPVIEAVKDTAAIFLKERVRRQA